MKQLCSIMTAAAWAVVLLTNPAQGREDTYKGLKTFSEVLSLVESNYVEEVKSKDLLQGAIRGMLRSLDPHTAYMTPEAFKEMQVETEGQFGGLGIEVTIQDDVLTVVAPIEGTPAHKAGVEPGDRIIKVDDASTKQMTLLEAVRLMRGPVGTPITITVVREGLEEPKEIMIIRDLIHIQSTRTRFIEPSIGYVRLKSFNKTTSKDLSKALEDLEGQGMKRLILDLRNNPGGLLDQAVETAGLFLESGKPIVTIKGRNPKKVLPPFTAQNSGHTDYPMVVLVNAGSASASEIVAGALQDHGRAVLLGATTFGKGSVQTIVPLSDGSGLRLTTAKYYTPKDRLIQGIGIEPDIVVSNDTPNAIADDVSRRRRMLRERDLKGALKGEKQTDEPDLPEDEWTKALRQDQQLQRAIELLNGWEILSNQTATTAPVPIAPHSAAQVQPTTQ